LHQLLNAIAKIENFDLEALSSGIILTGQGNIVDKQYNLVAKVTPAINDAVPIASYLTGGGLVGLGVWLVDEALFDGEIIGAIVNGAAVFEYKITGSWDDPSLLTIFPRPVKMMPLDKASRSKFSILAIAFFKRIFAVIFS
jgi:uncharacterized protein YhdP